MRVFCRYLDKNSLSSAIKNIPNPGGELNSVLSLGNLLTSSVKAATAQRPDAIMIAIGITDGAPIANNPLTVVASTALQALGMNACVICVTDRCPEDLAKSGSSPPREVSRDTQQRCKTFLGQGPQCIHSFIRAISIAPLQFRYYSEALPTQHGYCAGISSRSATCNCE